MLKLDHIVFATTDLDAGTQVLEAWLGTPLQAGGQHLGFGTHNRLLNLSAGIYLELIALDTSQTDLRHSAPFDLLRWTAKAQAAQPGQASVELIHAVAQTTVGLEALRASFSPEEQALLGQATPMTRGELAWTITTQPEGRLPGDGAFPTVIDWGNTPHPSQRLAASPIEFNSLEWVSPSSTTLSRVFLGQQGLRIGQGEAALTLNLHNRVSGKPLTAKFGLGLA